MFPNEFKKGLGSNWLDFEVTQRNEESKIDVENLHLDGDIGDISIKKFQIDPTAVRKNLESLDLVVDIKKMNLSELTKFVPIETFSRFFSNPGFITGHLELHRLTAFFTGTVRAVSIFVSQNGRSSILSLDSAKIESSGDLKIIKAKISEVETLGAVARGEMSVEQNLEKKTVSAKFDFDGLRVSGPVLKSFMNLEFNDFKAEGELKSEGDKLSRLNASGVFRGVKAVGLAAQEVKWVTSFVEQKPATLEITVDEVFVEKEKLDDSFVFVEKINRAVPASVKWSKARTKIRRDLDALRVVSFSMDALDSTSARRHVSGQIDSVNMLVVRDGITGKQLTVIPSEISKID